MIRLRTFRFGSLLAILAALSLLASIIAPVQAAGEWTATGAVVYGPMSHPAALLADGRVLVPGGTTILDGVFTCSLTDTQLFDPATNTWSATGSMNTGRALHTATTLNDGRVLVVGGVDCTIYISVVYASAEIFDPSTGTWSPTGSMGTARFNHTATLLNDGRVLIVSGSTAEIFDPATGTWSVTGNLSATRSHHTATLLDDGRVLVAGGFNLSSAELFDPDTGTWSTTDSMSTTRSNHTATRLTDGRVLVAGDATAEIFDPATGTWSLTGNLNNARSNHTATLLTDSRVLVAGGFSLNSAEIFDPATGTWSATGSMIDDRRSHTATRLFDGRVLVVGGDGSGQCCAELFTLTGGGGTSTPMFTPTSGPTVTPTPTSTPSVSITVIAPNGGEVWLINSTQTIQWSSEGITGNVRIEVSRNVGASYKPIANNVPNTGTFQWTVKKPATNQALIRVVSVDQPSVRDASDNVFRITQ